MGEMAEGLLDGTFCESCGEVMSDIIDGAVPPGYPRRCTACGGADDAEEEAGDAGTTS